MKITVSNKMTNPNPFDNDEFDMQSTGASSLSVTTDEGSNDVSVSSLQPSSSLKNTSCTSSPKSVATSSSSQQKQQQQQQTFRFQGLYKLLGKNNNKSSATDASKTLLSGDDTAAAATVVDHEKTVDHVLSGMETPEQARDLLRGIVADLLRENDSLKALLQEKEQALQATQEECNIVKEEYTDRLISIKKTVERSIGGASCGFEIIPNTKNGTEAAAAPTAASKLPVISPEQAINMVIQSLSNKVEQLSVEKETLEQELTQTIERMEDLESINESRLYKIEALEAQFRSINKTRLNTAQPNVKASCRRQGTDSPAFEVTLPSRAITPRSTTSSSSSSSSNGNSSSSPTQQQPTAAAKVVVTPTVGPTTDTGMSPVKNKTKTTTTTPQPPTTKSKKMSRSTPRQAFITNDFNSFIEVGPGMGEI